LNPVGKRKFALKEVRQVEAVFDERSRVRPALEEMSVCGGGRPKKVLTAATTFAVQNTVKQDVPGTRNKLPKRKKRSKKVTEASVKQGLPTSLQQGEGGKSSHRGCRRVSKKGRGGERKRGC